MKTGHDDHCTCDSYKKYKSHCAGRPASNTVKKYINEAHEWMDKKILKGRYPDLYGFLILVDHNIPAEEIWDQLRFWSEQYIDFGEDRTRLCHRIIDETIEYQAEADRREGFRPAFCHKGCSNCCYQPVACTDEEARLIYRFCSEYEIDIDYKKLERQQAFIEFDSDNNFTGRTTWNNQPEEDQACVFLDRLDETCRIWQMRPFVCRVHLAEKTDRHCRSQKLPSVLRFHFMEKPCSSNTMSFLSGCFVLTQSQQ